MNCKAHAVSDSEVSICRIHDHIDAEGDQITFEQRDAIRDISVHHANRSAMVSRGVMHSVQVRPMDVQLRICQR